MTDTITRPKRTTLPDLDQGTDQWHDQRRGIITASVVGNLITTRKLSAADYDCPACSALANGPCMGKTKTPGPIKSMHPERAAAARNAGSSSIVFETASNDQSRSLTTMLTAERITGWTEDMFVSDDMMRGVEDEPKARDKYSEHYAEVAEVGFMTYEDHGIKIGYSPDGLVGNDGLIEIKSRRPKKHLSTVLSGHPPAENMAQLQTGLLVSGRQWIDYVSFCGGMPLWVKRVYPDRRWFDAILAAAGSFEANAAEMIRLYEESIEGFPMTERILIQEII